MNILIFHPVRLPAKTYGGVERVVLWLAKGLIEQGHRVWVLALEGSRLPEGMELIPTPSLQVDPSILKQVMPKGIDVVHFMAPPGDEILQWLDCPHVVTVHGNGKPGEVFPQNTVFLSQNHAARHGSKTFVYNGIDPKEYRFESCENKDSFRYLFFSKTSWKVKNLRGAINYCAQAGVKLNIAGGERPLLLRSRIWLGEKLRRGYPLHWVGSVSGEEKAELLRGARALVFPVVWDEPFGLVVVESLISGTPVLASKRGSLPELVPDQCGALLETDSQWVEALSEGVAKWRPDACRDWVMENFHYQKMAKKYEVIYERVRDKENLNPVQPKSLT